MSNTILHHQVMAYQVWGLPVIPVRRGRPLVQWRGFIHRPPAPDDQVAWPWHEADGLAIILGHRHPHGGHWWVWDVEAEHRPVAEAWLDDECPGWRRGLVAESQRGGLHIYCLSQRPVTTTKHEWGDIKGVGSLVYAPPTKAFKPDCRNDYRWLSYQPEEALVLEPADLPAWGSNGHHQEPLSEALKRTIPVGMRNVTLTRVAGWLRGEGQLEPHEILAVLKLMNRRCEEPLPESELEAIAKSAGRWTPNPVLAVGNRQQSPVTSPSDSDSDDSPEAVDISTLAEPAPREWLLPDLLPAGTVTTWFGDDGTGKSVLTLALALCVASGQPFLDRPVPQGRVLYVDTEFDQEEFVRRAYRLARGFGWSAPPPGVIYHRTRYSLTTPGGQRDLVRLVEQYQPVLVVVDSVTLGSYTDDLKEAAAAVTLMEFLQRLPATVLALDHIPKPAPGTSLAYARPWGSFAKRAKARHVVLVTPAEAGGLVLRVTKSNLAKAGAMVGVDITWGEAIEVSAVPLDDEALAGVEVHLPPLEQVYRTLAQHVAITPDELAQETGLAVGTVKNKLTALRRQGRAEPLGDGRWRAVRPASSLTTHPSDSDDDPGKPNISHPDVDCDVFPPSSLITEYKDSDSDDGYEKHHNPHVQAKIGEHDPSEKIEHAREKPDISDVQAKIGGHEETYPQSFHHKPDVQAKIGGHNCVVCGRPVAQWGSRPVRYCSDACRMRAQRQRKESEPVDKITPGQVPLEASAVDNITPRQVEAVGRETCLECGQPIEAEGFRYRCPPCLKAKYDELGREYPEKLVRWLETRP